MLQAVKSWDTIVSNPHISLVQEVLSKGKKKKTKLTGRERAVKWDNCGRRKVLQKYRSLEPIVLPCNISELPNDIFKLKKLVMKVGVRASAYELTNHYLEKQLASIVGTNKYI